MIFLNEQSEKKLQFENLLQQTKTSVVVQLVSTESPSKISGNEFERIVYENAVENSIGTIFENKLERTADQAFPDIVDAGLFGVEVKATSQDKWTSTGNSVLESTRVNNVEKIYMFFGKLGGSPDVKFRNYEECLKSIVATHHPRYTIDMNLAVGDSIFDKMHVPYDEIRNSDRPIKYIREYYRNQLRAGESLWWVDDTEPVVSPIVKTFTSLSSHDKSSILSDIFIRFPEVLSEGNRKFANVATYLAARYGVVSYNLRDNFTAGGVFHYDYDGTKIVTRHIVGELLQVSPLILTTLATLTPVDLANYWKKHVSPDKSATELWMEEINSQSSLMDLPVSLSDLVTDATRK